jgi:cholesterol transport system auxiliary component
MSHFLHKGILFLSAFVVSGCTGLASLSDATAPVDLYLLTPKSTFDPNLPRLRQQIVVTEPTATAAVSNDRITVQPTPLEVRFLPGARWVDRAPLIIQSLMIESFENSNKVDAVGRSAIGLRADYLIVTDVREFQAIISEPDVPDAPLVANVRLNIKIVAADTDTIIASRSIEKLQASSSDDAKDIVTAFDLALGRVLKESVEWSIRRIHRHYAGQSDGS